MSPRISDPKGRPVVVVTGIGIMTALGQNKAENWEALTAGRSGIHSITRFSTEGFPTTIAGTVDFLDLEPVSGPALAISLATASATEAIEQAKIGTKLSFPGPLFLATPPAEIEWHQRRGLYQAPLDPSKRGYARLRAVARAGDFQDLYALCQFAGVGEHLADHFGTQGQPISVTTACASGASAIQLGVESIRRGDADAALCVGTDGSIRAESLVRFSLLAALSTQNEPPERAAKPFSKDRDGFVMAEGSAALVLESYAGARARNARILGVVRGCGERADGFHRTRSTPDGSAIIGAIRNALDDASMSVEDIDYINAHGTGTPENDKMEYVSLAAVFGERLAKIPISSNKSILGHALTAAGTIEAAFSLMTIQNGVIPPTLNYDIPDPEIPLDVVPNQKREKETSTVLSNSFGFGGQNVCLVVSSEPR